VNLNKPKELWGLDQKIGGWSEGLQNVRHGRYSHRQTGWT